jgi:two-component system, NtrC family, sensor kinase
MPNSSIADPHLQQRLTLLTTLNPLAVIEWNSDFEVVAWNPAAEKIFGYREDEMLGRSSLDGIVPEADREHLESRLKALLKQKSQSSGSNKNLTKDGRVILCEWHNLPLVDELDHVIGMISMAQDITDRERATELLRKSQKELEIRVEERTFELQKSEDALRRSEASYRALLAAMPDLIMRLTREGIYLDFIPSNSFLVFKKPEEGMMLQDTLPPQLAELRKYYLEQAFQTGEVQIYEQEIEINGIIHPEEIRIVVSDANEALVIVRNIGDRKAVENQLKASQQLLQLVIDNIPQKISWKDIDCVFLGCNQGFADDIGLASPAEIVGKTDYDLALPKDQIHVHISDDLRIMSSGVAELHFITPNNLPNGQVIWIDGSKIPLRDDRGNVVGILGTYEDVTERKRAETVLKETLQKTEYQSQLLRTILDTSPDWIFAKDRQFRYLMVNQSFSDAIGKPITAILGKDDLTLGCPEKMVYGDLEQEIQGFHTADQAVIQGETFYESCSEITMMDGVARIFETKKVPLRDAQGEVFGVFGVSRDVTDRHHVEQRLKASQEFLDSILDGIPDPVFVKDDQHCWVLANRAFCEMLGLEREKLIGKSDYDVSLKEHADVFWEQDSLVLSTETENVNEEYHSDMAGNIRFISTKKTCFRDVENNKFLVGVIRDISDRKASEEALRQSEAQLRQQTQDLEQTLQKLQQAQSQLVQSEKMSSLGQLVAGVSHEINNPVSFIYGNLKHATLYTQDLLELIALYQEQYPEPLPAIQKRIKAIELEYLASDLPKLLSSMKVGADRIQEIVRSLRVFSRMDEAEMKAVDIHEGIESTLMILQSRLKAQGDRPAIVITKSYGAMPLIECYAGQLNQVFMNILGNGVDALEESLQDTQWLQKNLQQYPTSNEEPEAFLELGITTELINKERVRIKIKDNGVGMSEKVRKNLFNPFFTTKPVGKGTGMGLSISYQIITEKHGGILQCFSAIGQGAEFVIEIPVRQSKSIESPGEL